MELQSCEHFLTWKLAPAGLLVLAGFLLGPIAIADPVDRNERPALEIAATLLPAMDSDRGVQLAIQHQNESGIQLRVLHQASVDDQPSYLTDVLLDEKVAIIPLPLENRAEGSVILEATAAGGPGFSRQEHTLADLRGSAQFAWQSAFRNPDLDRRVRAMTVWNDGSGPALYVGGDFVSASDVLDPVNAIVRWDGDEWTPLTGFGTDGVNGLVNALAVYQGDLYVGGSFSNAGGLNNTHNIARYDGNAWSQLGPAFNNGANNQVRALIEYDGKLIVGGAFTAVSGNSMSASRIASWDGENWSTLAGPEGQGTNGWVNSLELFDGKLIVGGGFASAGGVTVNRIASWDGEEWAALVGTSGTGVGQFGVDALQVFEGDLIVGGSFTQAGGISVGRIARWTGEDWAAFPVDPQFDGPVLSLGTFDGQLIAGGEFITAEGNPVNRIAIWNGTGWGALEGPAGVGLDQPVLSLTEFEGELIGGGEFASAGGEVVNFIARWNPSGWSPLSTGESTAIGGNLNAIVALDGHLYAGGLFDYAGGVFVSNVARWDGEHWSPVGDPSSPGTNSPVLDLTVHDNQLFAAGSFSTAGDTPVSRVARWDGSEWHALAGPDGEGVDGTARVLGSYEGSLIVAGTFFQAGGVNAARIARWDGTNWAALSGPSGQGVSGGEVSALVAHEGKLYAGGSFTQAGGIAVNRIASWNEGGWEGLQAPGGNGLDGSAFALASFEGDLVVGGQFFSAGGVIANNIARWDGEDFFPLIGPTSNGANQRVESLIVHDGRLIAGGMFTSVGGRLVNRIGAWDGSEWNALTGPNGIGMNGGVFSLASIGEQLYASGLFTSSGGIVNRRLAMYSVLEVNVDLQIELVACQQKINAGESLTYRINVLNNGPDSAEGVLIESTLPGAIDASAASWTCSVSQGTGECLASGTGDIADLADLDSGAVLNYELEAPIPPGLGAMELETSVSLVPPAGATDASPAANQANHLLEVLPALELIFFDQFLDPCPPVD